MYSTISEERVFTVHEDPLRTRFELAMDATQLKIQFRAVQSQIETLYGSGEWEWVDAGPAVFSGESFTNNAWIHFSTDPEPNAGLTYYFTSPPPPDDTQWENLTEALERFDFRFHCSQSDAITASFLKSRLSGLRAKLQLVALAIRRFLRAFGFCREFWFQISPHEKLWRILHGSHPPRFDSQSSRPVGAEFWRASSPSVCCC